MVSSIFVFVFLIAFSFWFSQNLNARYPETNLVIFRWLIFYHAFLSFIYYLYASFNPSDSVNYYATIIGKLRGETWFEFYGVSTAFIEFIGYPFIHFMGFSYEAMMILFAWFGLIGFFYFYIVLKERLLYSHKFFGYDLLMIVLFLPNLHFWSGSFGKGSIIFLGFGLYFFALNKIQSRWLSGVIGAMIIYHVRPHILFVVLLASLWGFVFSSRGISVSIRVLVIMVSIGAFYYIREDVMALTGINEDTFLTDSTTLSTRASELSKASSGVDISNYNFFMKLFTFWFRPLFVDAPGILGIVVSFENLFYLLIFTKVFRSGFIQYFRNSDHVVKASVLTFIGVSAALAQIAGNLGLAMRQKSQVMMLMMFVILKFMDEQRYQSELLREQRERIKANRAQAMKLRQQGGRQV